MPAGAPTTCTRCCGCASATGRRRRSLRPRKRARLPAAARPGDPYAPLLRCEEWTASAWRLLAGDVVDGGPNPYGEIPYIVFPNLRVPGEFWGESDLVDLLDLQRELNTRI